MADASKGGSAVAEFQIGHVLAYDGTSPFPATVTFNVAYYCTLKGYTPQYGDRPLGLKAYVMDSDRRMLGKIVLAESDPDRVPDRWSGSQSPSFDVTFEPGLAYHLVVAGRVEVSGDDTMGAVATLNMRSLTIQIVPQRLETRD